MTAMAGIAATCATGTFLAGAFVVSQAQAEDITDLQEWNGSRDNDHVGTYVIKGPDGCVSINAFNDKGESLGKEANAGNNGGASYKIGTSMTVEEGGQLWINLSNAIANSGTDPGKQIAGELTLQGIAPGEDTILNATYWLQNANVVFKNGSYNFEDILVVDGYGSIFSDDAGSQGFVNLSSSDDTAVLNLIPNKIYGKNISYLLNFNDKKTGDRFKAFNGTLIINNPFDDGVQNDNPWEMVRLEITNARVVGTEGAGARYVLNGSQTALYLKTGGITVPTVESHGGIIRSCTNASQVHQVINTLDVTEGYASFWMDGGSVAWDIDHLTGDSDVYLHNGAEGYKPTVIYLNEDNVTDPEGTTVGFTGTLALGDYSKNGVDPTEQYGVYQDYVQVNATKALAEANLRLIGDAQKLAMSSEDGNVVLNNDSDPWRENFAVAALNASDVYVGTLEGSMLSVILSGQAPTYGTADNPSTTILPETAAGTVTLHVGAVAQAEDSPYVFRGEILRNVDITKEGVGTQIVYNLENDPTRFIRVTEGVLELGSVGDFRRVIVDRGARAEIGLTVDSEVHTWGTLGDFTYFQAKDNGIDVTDTTKVQGNIVLSDKIYGREYTGDWEEETITVISLDASSYKGDSLTLVDADLAVFNPKTGTAADFGNVKTITVTESSSLVSSSPLHHSGLMRDPGIVVDADIQMQGDLSLMAYGSLGRSSSTGEVDFTAFNTTYTGAISYVPTVNVNGDIVSVEETTSVITKDGYGQVTLAGDMSDYGHALNITDGTLTLSGSNGKDKAFSTLYSRVRGKAVLELTDGANVTMDRFYTSTYKIEARTHCLMDIDIEAGSTLSLTGVNKTLNDNSNDKEATYMNATFLVAAGTNTTINIDGTFNMLRSSWLTVTPLETRYEDVGKKEINVNAGGVFNAKGVWLQSYSTSENTTLTINIKDGGTLNLGEDGLGHVALNGKGNSHGPNVNNLVVNFEDGATLGIVNDAVSWSSEREITLDGVLTVNTQGYVVDESSTLNGNAKTISLGDITTLIDTEKECGIVKVGAGTLAVGGKSILNDVLVKDGYLTINATKDKYRIDINNLKTEDSGALLFDLAHATNVAEHQTGAALGQMHVNLTGVVDGTVNVTVKALAGEEANGKTYCIFTNAAPDADSVKLTALVDDGWYAIYELGEKADVTSGYVTLTYDATKLLGNDKVLTWATADGDSNFWANSTEANWQDDSTEGTRRFTNGSCVEFTQAGETVTLLGDVEVADHDGHAAMVVGTTGYDFTGTGSITSEDGHLVVEDGVHVTFSNSGNVTFGGGVTLGSGSTIRLEYLNEDSSNWNALITGEGILEIATGGTRTQVLDQVMGDSIGAISLDNNTTLALVNLFSEAEAAKLAQAGMLYVNEGSRLYVNNGMYTDLFDAGDKLYLAGAGTLTDEESSSAALAAVNPTAIHADIILSKDATVYTETGATIYADGAYNSMGFTLSLEGSGSFQLSEADSSTHGYGDIAIGQHSQLNMDFSDADSEILYNHITMSMGAVIGTRSDVTLSGGIDTMVNNTFIIDRDSTLTIDSTVTGSSSSRISLMNRSGFGSAVCTLATDNDDFVGTWDVGTYVSLRLDSAYAAQKATINGAYVGSSELVLGDTGAGNPDRHFVAGVSGELFVTSADPTEGKTLEIIGDDVYSCYGMLDSNVSIVQNGRGAQYFTSYDSFASDYQGNITVKNGLLQFRYAPDSYDTITIATDDAQLGFGYNLTSTGEYRATDLMVSTGQTLLISETGAALNANLAPVSGGQITLGADKTGAYWEAKGGLSMFGQSVKLDTSDKGALTVNLSPFLQEGDYVELFTHVGTLVIDGVAANFKEELGYLEDYFVCDDINLARTKLELTAEGTVRIKLINNSDGMYYQYAGGDNGEWNSSDANWARKDDETGRYTYEVSAAYFTNDDNATVRVTEDVEAREMAVKNGKYTFELEDGNDVSIDGRYYEMADATATFELNSLDTVDADGNPISEGSVLTIGSGMGDIDSTVVKNADGSTANRLVLGGTTSMSGDARFEDIDLFLDGDKSALNLGSTKATSLQGLSGDAGSITADGGKLTITNETDGVFVGKFLAANDDTAAGANTLIIEQGDPAKSQNFSNVTTDSSWNLINNGTLTFTPTAGSTLHSLTLGANSVTDLAIDTDADQMLGLTSLIVEEGAKITLNSVGNAPIMSGEDTPGMSYAVIGSFADDGSLQLGDNGELEIELGSGTAFLMIDKEQPITLNAVWNEETGYYDVVLKATVDDANKFAPFAKEEGNAAAGADMLWTPETMQYIGEESNGDLAQAFNAMSALTTSTSPDGKQIQEALAAVAGSSTAGLGSAFSADEERQLKAIRNRTTTKGVSHCEDNENMPYYNAWINA